MAEKFGPEQLEYSTGGPMANQPIYVRLRGSLQLAELFSDEDEMAGAANPVMTDSTGMLVFYAHPGYYDLVYGNVEVPIVVGDPGSGALLRSYTHHQVVPATRWTVNFMETLGYRPAGLQATETTGDTMEPGFEYEDPFVHADYDAPTAGYLHMS